MEQRNVTALDSRETIFYSLRFQPLLGNWAFSPELRIHIVLPSDIDFTVATISF